MPFEKAVVVPLIRPAPSRSSPSPTGFGAMHVAARIELRTAALIAGR